MRRIEFIAVCLASLGGRSLMGAVPSSARSKKAVERTQPRLKAEFENRALQFGAPVFLRIFKEPPILEVWSQKGTQFERFRTYRVCKFSGSLGPKVKEGDRQAPEGVYRVEPSQMNPNSRFHLSFNLGYPNTFDRHHGRTGSALMVHGDCVSVGCFAMGDEAIEEIWTICTAALESGQNGFDVHIYPFPLRDSKLKKHAESRWNSFWRELQPIYDAFESTSIPPSVTVESGKYVVR